nr:nitrophenyl compound nitroreductase subunit ArsF family protein [uncultured Methanospirillum sp.]
MEHNQIRFSLMLLIIAVFIGVMLSAGCTSPAGKTAGAGVMSPVEKVEVYHFHPTNGCRSCTIVGDYAEETVNTFFPNELKNKKIVFDHINYQEPKSADLVERYGVTGSSLMIGVYNKTAFNRESNHKVWYMTGNKTQYMNYLKGVIDLRLAGDLS